MLFVFFTPMLSSVCDMGRRSLIENESCCTETNESENGEKAENSVDKDIYTAKGLCVTVKLDEETAGVRYNIWFR